MIIIICVHTLFDRLSMHMLDENDRKEIKIVMLTDRQILRQILRERYHVSIKNILVETLPLSPRSVSDKMQ